MHSVTLTCTCYTCTHLPTDLQTHTHMYKQAGKEPQCPYRPDGDGAWSKTDDGDTQ